MRKGLLIIALVAAAILALWGRTRLHAPSGDPAVLAAARLSAPKTAKPDFEKEIKPIFQAKCQPCHFQGGQVYAKLPFDKPETIIRLGTKLFTRIKDEKEQRLIREFLEQP
ncbi:MAG TPA: hypothetical protein VLN44_04735 [Pyrinomonadaceae bacterium]|nr:hypothetical protein [Pyrinomonadaceae bacterium]